MNTISSLRLFESEVLRPLLLRVLNSVSDCELLEPLSIPLVSQAKLLHEGRTLLQLNQESDVLPTMRSIASESNRCFDKVQDINPKP